jgi:hypothetical protein
MCGRRSNDSDLDSGFGFLLNLQLNRAAGNIAAYASWHCKLDDVLGHYAAAVDLMTRVGGTGVLPKDALTSLLSLLTANRRRICEQFSTGFWQWKTLSI